ncbi:hypothetical protein P7C70_g9253, partial [Phenoliferia sp. Uapishka_3]
LQEAEHRNSSSKSESSSNAQASPEPPGHDIVLWNHGKPWTATELSRLENEVTALKSASPRNQVRMVEWADIAARFGRQSKAVQVQWISIERKKEETLRSQVSMSPPPVRKLRGFYEWDAAEDAELTRLKHSGKEWSEMSMILPGRDAKSCKSRWLYLESTPNQIRLKPGCKPIEIIYISDSEEESDQAKIGEDVGEDVQEKVGVTVTIAGGGILTHYRQQEAQKKPSRTSEFKHKRKNSSQLERQPHKKHNPTDIGSVEHPSSHRRALPVGAYTPQASTSQARVVSDIAAWGEPTYLEEEKGKGKRAVVIQSPWTLPTPH